MNTQNDDNGSAANSMDDALDAGLRAAFGGTGFAETHAVSVVASLEETLGIHPRVLLRDARDDQTPIAITGRAASPGRDSAVGRYQVAGEIARGGVGVVLKGRDPDLGRDVAIKVLRTEHSGRPGMVERFIEEAQIAAQLQHPGILPVYELGVADARRPFFSMKLIKGRTLAALLSERSDPVKDRLRCLAIFEQVCQAVAYAHAKGVIHRDLKPSNVMVGAFGEVHVVDWGLAKVLSMGGLADEGGATDDASMVETVRTGENAALSMAGSVFGTPAYMSPEQARGEVDRLDERSDVFSLGAILCEILTGAPPFAGDRSEALHRAREAELAGTLASLAECEADAELVALASRCLSAKPADRPRDAGVVAEQVAAHLALLAERARTSELAAARSAAIAQQERRARRLTVALASVVLLAICGVSVGVFWVQQDRALRQSIQVAAVNQAIDVAAQSLGQAIAAPVGRAQPWFEVASAANQVKSRLAEGGADPATRQRAETFLKELAAAERDRRLIEKIEEVVIFGATHQDRQSWEWMEAELRRAFLDYGIDLQQLGPKETATRIRQSDLAAQLADGLELWVATICSLPYFGGQALPMEEAKAWTAALHEADPDPFASAVRKLVYAEKPDLDEVRRLAESVDFTKVRPRTLTWLASTGHRMGDLNFVREVFRRAMLIYPDDMMLNFDYAYNMMAAKDYPKAIRAYERCLAIRPGSAGVWRSLGLALREVKDYEGALDALRESIVHQPNHAPTHVDLGITLQESGDVAAAVVAYEHALKLNPQLETARKRLDEAGRPSGARDNE